MRSRWPVLLLLLLLLSGCWSRVELNDLGLVLGLAIDEGEEGHVRLSLYVARSKEQRAGEEKKSVGGDPVWVVSREAQNLSDAMREITMASARRISLHHVRVVLIGEEFARKGLRGSIDFLARNPQIRLTLEPMVVRGKAQTVLETSPQLKSLQPDNLTAIISSRGGVQWDLKDYLVARVSDTHSGWMHAVSVIQRPAGTPGTPETAAVIDGAGLFLSDRLVMMIKPRESQILSWLLGNPRESVISTSCPDFRERSFSAEVDEGDVKIRPILEGGSLRIEVMLHGKMDLIRLGCPAIPLLEEPSRRKMEVELEQDLVERVQETIAIFQSVGADPAGFGKRVQLAYPAYWKTIREKWPFVWHDLPVRVTADIELDHSGLLIKPADKTEEELRTRKIPAPPELD